MNPLISVVVPVYKVEKYLKNCVESILKQTYTNWELILVDDGSPDTCPQLCDAYAEKDDRISVIHKENGGQASARNQGVKLAKGEYITFLDSDDFLCSEYLSKLISYAERYNADIVQCSYIRGTETKFPNLATKIQLKVYDNHSIFVTNNANVLLCCKLYRRDLLIQNPIVEGKFFEDDWTTWKYYYYANVIVVSNEQLYYYTYNNNSTMAAHANRNPDSSWIEPDLAKINFFQKTGERDFEYCARIQLCKVLIGLLCHPRMPKDLKSEFQDRFRENWALIKKSPIVNLKYRILFSVYYKIPAVATTTIKLMKK